MTRVAEPVHLARGHKQFNMVLELLISLPATGKKVLFHTVLSDLGMPPGSTVNNFRRRLREDYGIRLHTETTDDGILISLDKGDKLQIEEIGNAYVRVVYGDSFGEKRSDKR